MALTVDYMLRIISPKRSLFDNLTHCAQHRQYYGEPRPMPAGALLGRYIIYLSLFITRMTLKVTLEPKHPAVIFFSILPFFNLWAAWGLHFCFGYLPWPLLFRMGCVQMPSSCAHSYVAFTSIGPFYKPAPKVEEIAGQGELETSLNPMFSPRDFADGRRSV